MDGEARSAEEQRTWAYGGIAILGYGLYLAMLVFRRSDQGIAQTAYAKPMLIAISVAILLGIVVNSLIGLRADDAGTDVRDDELYRRGEYAGHWVLVAGAIGALILAMREIDSFWIANVIYLAFVLSAVASSVIRIRGYRQGFQPW